MRTILEYTTQATDELKTIHPSDVSWISSIIKRELDAGPRAIALKLRSNGKLMTPNELREIGVRANTKLSNKAFKALTTDGIKNPIQAYENLCIRVCGLFNRDFHLGRAKKTKDGCIKVWPHPKCKAANKAFGSDNFYKFGDHPKLDLPNCDFEICRCSYSVTLEAVERIRVRRQTGDQKNLSSQSSNKNIDTGFASFSKKVGAKSESTNIKTRDLFAPWITIGSLIAGLVFNGVLSFIFFITAIIGLIFWFKASRKYQIKK